MAEAATTTTATATTAGASGGQGAASTAGAGGGTGGTKVWYEGSSSESADFIKAKGYKDLDAMVGSHRHLESAIGTPKERLLKLPEKADDKVAWNDIYERLGKPKEAKDYTVPETVKTDPVDLKWMQDTFHEMNLTKAQGESLATKWSAKIQEKVNASGESLVTASNQQLTKLKEEWGTQFDNNAAKANQTREKLGLTIDDHKKLEMALGVDKFNKMMYDVQAKLGVNFNEPGFHRGETTQATKAQNAADAQKKINILMKDPNSGNKLKNDPLFKEEWDNLHKIVFGEEPIQ